MKADTGNKLNIETTIKILENVKKFISCYLKKIFLQPSMGLYKIPVHNHKWPSIPQSDGRLANTLFHRIEKTDFQAFDFFSLEFNFY